MCRIPGFVERMGNEIRARLKDPLNVEAVKIFVEADGRDEIAKFVCLALLIFLLFSKSCCVFCFNLFINITG